MPDAQARPVHPSAYPSPGPVGQVPSASLFESVRAVIFDCDGVLVDTESISNEVLIKLLREHGYTGDDSGFRGRPLPEIRAQAEADMQSALPEDFSEKFRVRQFAGFRGRVHAMPGVLPALSEIELPFRVCTNGTHAKMRFTLREAGILPLVDGRLSAYADVGRAKPAPDLFLAAAGSMGVAPRRCVVVEDTVIGIEAAKAAGMIAVGFVGPDAAEGQAEALTAAGAVTLVGDLRQFTLALPSARRAKAPELAA